MINEEPHGRLADAIQVARMYYYQNLNTETIAKELNVSRSTVSRLLSYAKEQGVVEIRIRNPQERPQRLEQLIQESFGVPQVQVVSVPELAAEREWLERVAMFSARYLDNLLESQMVLGLAWGTTVSAISRHLIPKSTTGCHIVQLNGAGNTQSTGISYAGEIVMRFAQNYGARPQLFPVPTFFDYPETKAALWRERSIKRILELQAQADVLLYSIGTVQAGIPSHVYSGEYLEAADLQELEREDVAGDIATVFFREDGSYADIPLNARASGPDLSLYKQAKRALCVVSGLGKLTGLRAVLKGGFLTDLIVDEPTARALVEEEDNEQLAINNE